MSMEANGGIAVTLNAAEYAQYLMFVAHTKDRNVAEKLKEAGLKAIARRQTLILRRVDKKAIAPDEDVAAYGEIYKLKNSTADGKPKIVVTDNEIKAYKVLDPDFKAAPALELLTAKVEEMVAAGELPKEGSTVEDDDPEE